MTTNEEVYEQACADVERSNTRTAEVEDLVRRIEGSDGEKTFFSKADVTPLLCAYREQQHALADAHETVSRLATRSRTIQVNAPAAEDARTCREWCSKQGVSPNAVHNYRDVAELQQRVSGTTFLYCTRCGKPSRITWSEVE